MRSDGLAFIYALVDPRSHEVRYIGQGYRPTGRFHAHLIDADSDQPVNEAKAAWIRELEAEGLRPDLVILDRAPDHLVLLLEAYYIDEAQKAGAHLLNVQYRFGTAVVRAQQAIRERLQPYLPAPPVWPERSQGSGGITALPDEQWLAAAAEALRRRGEERYPLGTYVKHRRFGPGRVVASLFSGDEEEVDVVFTDAIGVSRIITLAARSLTIVPGPDEG